MAKIFRNIRKRFLSENRFTKYLIYAIGEIFLVVIGILIALAINTNQEQKAITKKEQTYLAGLQNEFSISKRKLQELIRVNKANYEGAKTIVRHIDHPHDSLSEKEFSTLLFNTFASDISFNPNNALLNEMLSSGSLKDISNAQLKIYLSNWNATMDDIIKQDRELGIQREKILEIFRGNSYSIRTIFDLSGISSDKMGLEKAPKTISNLQLLQSPEFENNLLLFMLTSQATEQTHYLPLLENINEILTMIEGELKTP